MGSFNVLFASVFFTFSEVSIINAIFKKII